MQFIKLDFTRSKIYLTIWGLMTSHKSRSTLACTILNCRRTSGSPESGRSHESENFSTTSSYSEKALLHNNPIISFERPPTGFQRKQKQETPGWGFASKDISGEKKFASLR